MCAGGGGGGDTVGLSMKVWPWRFRVLKLQNELSFDRGHLSLLSSDNILWIDIGYRLNRSPFVSLAFIGSTRTDSALSKDPGAARAFLDALSLTFLVRSGRSWSW